MENYAKKYKDALERASKLKVQNPFDTVGQMVEHIFPELKEKESEDEKIRKEIYIYLDWLDGRKDYAPKGNYSIKDMSAWLEKLGKGKSALEAWKDMRLEVYLQASGNRHEPNYSDDSTKMFSLNDIDEIIEKISEQKSDDKVEPKFNVGDWIVFNGLILHIDEVVNGYYRTTSIGDGIHNSYDWDIDNAARLWTIEVAKDGDVLVCNINKAEIGDDVEKLPNMTPTIFIYQNVVNDSDYIHSYCSLYNRSSLRLQNAMYYNAFVCYIHPATKEEHDLLFQKMKEASYEWDSERKELKKIEPKSLNADKVIEWLDKQACLGWLEDVEVEKVVEQFKKDFGL